MKKSKTNKVLKVIRKKLHHHIKLTFVPHKLNQYRPHLVRRYGLLLLVLLVGGTQIYYSVNKDRSILGAKSSLTTASLLSKSNHERAARNLPPLQIDKKLTEAATLKAKNMLDQQYWAHTAPDGTEPWDWFAKAGYNYAYAGENLAKDFTSADSATTAWMASPTHRANILEKNYSDVGFAVANGELDGKPTTLVVAMYGKTATAGVAGEQKVEEAPQAYSLGFLTRLGIAIQSMTPATIGAMSVILVAAFVASAAHLYRHRLPKHLRQSWYRHHGAYKTAGMMSFAILIISLYSGGQI